MANETLTPNGIADVVADLIRKQGIIVVVLLALMYFIWDSGKNKRADDAKMLPVLQQNTEVISRNTTIQEIAIQAGKDNKALIEETRIVLDRLSPKNRRNN